VLVLGAAGTWWVARFDTPLGIAIGFTVGHFFLFCNVLRMARPLELTWSIAYVLLAGATISTGLPGWAWTFGLSLAVTCVLAGVQMRKPGYHGAFWRRINPGLQQWWEQNAAGENERRHQLFGGPRHG
jgi:hypothetical protein